MALSFLWNNSRMVVWWRCAWHWLCAAYYAMAMHSLHVRGRSAESEFVEVYHSWRHHVHEYEQLEKRL